MDVKSWTDAEVIQMVESLEDHCSRQAAALRELMALRAEVASLKVERDHAKQALVQAHRDFGCEINAPNETIWQYAARMQAEVLRLREELGKWPVTEDGVRITPGMTFYGFVGRTIASWTAEDIGFGFENGKLVWRWCSMRNYERVGPGCYSTREAAEAAKANRPG